MLAWMGEEKRDGRKHQGRIVRKVEETQYKSERSVLGMVIVIHGGKSTSSSSRSNNDDNSISEGKLPQFSMSPSLIDRRRKYLISNNNRKTDISSNSDYRTFCTPVC